ncbi:FecR domain-containing protein [Bradyrhizobium sp. Tv2a-2]|uniref:FecR domain-containing protein n=1 Tax=Bradyrhizobium sp. Tv2a-2 TaxID=113395 RepID=UPI0004117E9E|nr:FecR domain-containing protein [Bradyrhizobium sp. Tv2a-2]
MNYAGKFDATISSAGQGEASHSDVHVDSVHGHAPANAIIVPDAQFLFHADFKRSGLDLILHKDDHELVLHDYFKGDKRAAIASPDGAHLTGDIVNALTGSVDVAQAGGAAVAGQVIGHVTKLAGSATAIRNGVSIILNMGDNVEKGDVVQSGSDSTLGVTFIDGTVFGLSSNARMVLNEMVYDPNGSNNSSLLSLVAGTITFVAGETAKHGDMKVDTPVATMGIRGTAVLVEIDFTIPGQGDTPDAKFQVLVEPDGTTGSYILFDKTTLQPLAVVNQAGQQINISNGIISQSSAPLSPDVEKLIQDVFTLKFSANDTNPKTTTAQTDSTNPLLFGPVIKLANNDTAQPIFQVTSVTGNSSPGQNPTTQSPSILHIAGPPQVRVLDSHGDLATSFALTELPGETGPTDRNVDTVGGTIRFTDPNAGDQPTVSIALDHINYKGAVVDSKAQLVSGSLSKLELNDLQGAGVTINVVPASTNNNNGSATWTYSVADNAFDFLAAGETLVLTYNVRVDNNYAPNDEYATIPITITVTGTNDAPVITTSAQTIAFSGGTNVDGGALNDLTTGKLTFTDVDLDDAHKVAVKFTSAVMSDGTEVPKGPLDLLEKATTFTASIGTDSTGTGTGVIDWQLAALPVYIADFIPDGKTLTVTYTVIVTDSQGATSKQTVTVKITGTDSPAVVWIHTDGDGSPNNLWSNGQNWETGSAPTASDDVKIITDQLIGLTPSYPVTIDEKTAAFAHSLTMNDYSDYAGSSSPELDNSGSLTVSGQLSLNADSIFKNFSTASVGTADFYDTSQLVNSGTFTFGGLATFHDQSVLENSGTLMLQGGGEFEGASSITNDEGGTIEVSGGQLIVAVTVTNYGQITVDAGALLTLESSATTAGTIDGGTVSINGPSEQGGTPGTLEFLRSTGLQNGTLDNSGQVTVAGPFVAMHSETVINKGTLEIVWGTLTIDQGSTVSNSGTIKLDPLEGAELVLNDAAINGGLIVNGTLIYLNGGGVLKNGTLQNPGSVLAYGLGNSIDNEKISGLGGISVEQHGVLTIDYGSTITNPDVYVDGTLISNDATFDGGAVNNDAGGIIDLTGNVVLESGWLSNLSQINVSGAGNALDNETFKNNALEVQAGGALLIDQGTTVTNSVTVPATGEDGSPSTISGTITVYDSASLRVNDATITGGAVINNDGGTIDLSGAAVISNGSFGNFGRINVSGAGNVLDGETVSNTGGGAIDIIGALTLKDASNIANGEGNAETVESTGSLTLNDTSSIVGGELTNAGNIYIEASTGATLDGVAVDNSAGTIHVDLAEQLATLILDDGTSIAGGHLDIGGAGTLEVSTTGATLSGVTVENSHLVQVDESSVLALDGSTITGGSVVNDGTINSTGTSAIDGATITNDGLIAALSGTLTIDPGTLTNSNRLEADGGELDISGETVGNTGTIGAIGGGTLKLISSTIDNSGDGTVTVGVGSTLDLDHSGISGGTLIISGTLDSVAGSNVITAAITEDGGSINVTGGSLDLAGSVAGDVKIAGSSTVELGASGATAYAATAVIFEAEATGTLVLDHAESFTGTIKGLDDGTIDLADISYGCNVTVSYSGNAAGGILSVLVNGLDVSNIKLVGDYLGVHWILGDDGTSQHGTTLKEVPGVIAGLDANGNADEGDALTVSITDGGAAVTGVSYDWQVSSDGVHWHEANGSNGQSGYAPVGADDGQQLRVSLSFTDANGNRETGIVSAGTVQAALSVTLDSSSASEGRTIHVTGVTEGGSPVSDVTYDWQVSSDGVHWTEANGSNGHSSYTPVVADENQDLRLETTFAGGPAGPQSAINDLGAVQTPTITITVETATGMDFIHHDVLALMGAGTVRPGGSSSFTVVDARDHVEFVVTGSNFTYDGRDITGGTITSFEEFKTGAKPVALANFTGLSVDAGIWMADVQLDAHGVKGPLKALTGPFAYDFIGGSGNDSFGVGAPAGEHTTLTGGGGSDLFQYQKGYGAVTITDFDQGDTGTFTHSEGDKIELDGFNGKPSITYVNGNTVADFGHGDVLTLLGVDSEGLKHSDFIWISSGYRSGDQLTINGKLDGDFDTKFAVADNGNGGTDTVLNHPVIDTTHFSIQQNKDGTDTIFGLQVSDSDPASAASLSLSASTEAAPDSTISPSSGSGTLDDINSKLASGITYNPGTPQPQADMINVTVTDNFGASDTVHFVFNQAGQGPHITLQGTSGDDVIFGTGNSDTLTGNGGHDQFVFAPTNGPAAVQHTITDFNVNLDTIDLRQFTNISTTADALATATQHGNDTLLTIDSQDTILLKNVFVANLHAGDFIVTPHTGL